MPPFPIRASDILVCPQPQYANAHWQIALANQDDPAAIATYVKLTNSTPAQTTFICTPPSTIKTSKSISQAVTK